MYLSMSEIQDSEAEEPIEEGNSFVENVRILPPSTIFDDPFEGKHFESEIVLQNVGNHPVFVRIMHPTSSNIIMKPIINGHFLSPGMKIKRKITYTVVMATLVKSFVIPIYINDNLLSYRCEVVMPQLHLELDPAEVDFGTIDVGPITTKRTLTLTNKGLKPRKFSIDLGVKVLNIVVDPPKGMVMEKSSVKLTVELNASFEGSYETEFWIVSDSPICVKVFVKVVMGIMECIHEDAMKTFTFIKFPQIYYGTKAVKSVLLKNTSQTPSLFCITGENNCKFMHLSEISKIDHDYDHFKLSPMCGRLPSNDRRPFLLTFEPKPNKYKKRFPLILVTIHKILCSDICMANYAENVFREFDEVTLKSAITQSLTCVTSDGFILSSDFMSEEDKNDNQVPPMRVLFNNVRVMLFGETEEASVSVLPDELILTDPPVSETTTRTLTLTNNSKILPIYYRYVKVTFVEVIPAMGFLKTNESREIYVTITPKSCWGIHEFIRLELLYHDTPRLDGPLKVVGGVKVPIKFQAVFPKNLKKREFVTANTFSFDKPNQKPNREVLAFLKTESDMLALPNDRPLTLRPWKTERRCRTVYAAIPRLLEATDEYQLNSSAAKWKKINASYYKNYLESLRDHNIRSHDSSVSTVIAKRWDVPCLEVNRRKSADVSSANFLPLTPMELFNVMIHPRDAFIEGIMARSSFSETITVTNNNDVAIRVFLRPHKMHVFHFPSGERMVVGPNQSQSKLYMCFSEASGTRTHLIDMIVNENHIFCISVTVKVSPALLDFNISELTYKQNDLPIKYVELTNTLNATIEFIWDFTGDFIVDPMEGSIQSGKALTCCMYYFVEKCNVNNYELQVKMDNKRLKTIRVRVLKANFPIKFLHKVNFSGIGKNVQSTITAKLENLSVDNIPFAFSTDELLDGMSIEPLSGMIPKLGFVMIAFTVNSEDIGAFQCETVLGYAKFFSRTVNISGTINLPKVILTPQTIRFRKMAASSFDVKCFTVENVSNVTATVHFDVDLYPEMHYSEYTNSKFLTDADIFKVPPRGKKVFSIHLYPYYPTITSFHLPIKISGSEHWENRSCPTIKLYITTLNHRLLIDTWQYNFIYFPHYNFKSHTEEQFTMSVKEPSKFCIRFDELRDPFYFEHVGGGNITVYPYSIVCVLKAEEEIIFKLQFRPSVPGTYLMKLPIYVKDDLSEDMHNYFYVTGEYPKPEIVFNVRAVYLGLVPLNYVCTRHVVATLKNHNPDCKLDAFVDNFNVTAELDHAEINAKSCECNITIVYSSGDTNVVDTDIKVFCSCGVAANLRCLGGADNCTLTMYSCTMFYMKKYNMMPSALYPNSSMIGGPKLDSKVSIGMSPTAASLNIIEIPPFESTFPCFPTEEDTYTEYMEKLVVCIEQWVYEQIFHKTVYYTIPDTICVCEVVTKPGKTKKLATKSLNIPYYNILKFYCGNTINTLFDINYNKDNTFSHWIFGIYGNIVDFLKQLGAIIPHVSAEYLLEYRTYKDLMSSQFANAEVLNSTEFYLISKQCWLDVILQTFRVLEYQRQFSYSPAKSSCNMRRSSTCVDTLGKLNQNLFSYECSTLLNWLDKMLDEHKRKLASNEFSTDGSYKNIKSKYVRNFDEDLIDSLAYIAVTIKYCPYIAKHFYGIYVPAYTREEHIHNASLLLKVWNMLDISFELEPMDIIEVNPVLNQILCTYLFEFLSHMYPKDTLYFYSPLGEKTGDVISIGNQNDVTIKFEVRMFNNDQGTFSTDANSVVVAHGEIKKLQVSYKAKFATKHTVTLLLNGEDFSGKFFTNSKSFTLVGEPLLTGPLFDVTVSSPVFVTKAITKTIQSPFHKVAEYEIFFTTTEPENLDTLNLIPYSMMFKTNTIGRAKFSNYIFTSTRDGQLKISGRICCIIKNVIRYWFFFKSKVGDFYTTIAFEAKPNPNDIIPLILNLTNDVFKGCTCRHKEPDINNFTCPRNIKVPIPTQNQSLWNTVTRLYLEGVDEKEQAFWTKYQDTEVGPVLLKRILQDRKQFVTQNMSYMFKEHITFNIFGNKKECSHASKIHIDTNKSTVETIVHINTNKKMFTLILESEDLLETRTFEIFL